MERNTGMIESQYRIHPTRAVTGRPRNLERFFGSWQDHYGNFWNRLTGACLWVNLPENWIPGG